MKSSIIVCQLDSGVLHSMAFPTFAEANDAASFVRKSRTVEIGKKALPVSMAVVLTQNSQSAQVIKMINCKAEANRELIEAKVKAEAKKKAEAEAKAKAEAVK